LKLLKEESIYYNNNRKINIEVEKEIIEIGADETIFIFRFYETKADRRLLIIFEDQVVEDTRYLIFKKHSNDLKFPYSAYIDKDLIN
jgi:hypothetical protein